MRGKIDGKDALTPKNLRCPDQKVSFELFVKKHSIQMCHIYNALNQCILVLPLNEGQAKTCHQRKNKNFIIENICSAIRSVPHKPEPRVVDTRLGDFHSLDSMGIYPKYRVKKVQNIYIYRMSENYY